MNQFKTIFLEEAVFFLDSLPEQARDKVLYNIYKVEGGVKKQRPLQEIGRNRNMEIQDSVQWNPI